MVDEELLALTPALLLGCVSSSFLVSFFYFFLRGPVEKKRARISRPFCIISVSLPMEPIMDQLALFMIIISIILLTEFLAPLFKQHGGNGTNNEM